jgi:hypothetical protein
MLYRVCCSLRQNRVLTQALKPWWLLLKRLRCFPSLLRLEGLLNRLLALEAETAFNRIEAVPEGTNELLYSGSQLGEMG